MARTTTPAETPTEVKETYATNPPVGEDFIGQAVGKAVQLITAKKKIQHDLGEVRALLSTAASQGLATPEQTEWINKYLPKRTRNRNGDSSDD